ncbi:Eukaryotic glutathione synthase [Giardia duodenalis]|uniref:glutathione synthase n=2 Tax=Giardia intestinalis TaxID=5741 RepID=C6LZ01_GIAIB|nr:Glutathione synthetase, putative [Giardia intestinalis ATCC 50581]ESU44217.1 Eukaryotic glutathione synthase [Giardia intestinalis]
MTEKMHLSMQLRQRAEEAGITLALPNGRSAMVPIASDPYLLDRAIYDEIVAKADLLGRFIVEAALDSDLIETVANRCRSDKVCETLWRIVSEKKRILGQAYVTILRNSTAILQRADFYVVNGSPRLIEINTVSVGLLSMSARLADIHASSGRHGVVQSNLVFLYSSLARIAVDSGLTPSIWLMVVSEDEPMVNDQLGICQGYNAYCIAHSISSTMIRSTCKELVRIIHVQGNTLIASHEDAHLRIAGAYWRTGYAHEHCTSEYERLRTLLETHSLVSIPTAEAQLVGMKIVQNMVPALATTDKYAYLSEAIPVLSKVLDSPRAISSWIASALDTNTMVLKSVAEGGGHCVFGDDILTVWDALLRAGPEAASTHFLMDRLTPDGQGAVQFIYPNQIIDAERADAEVGVYSFCLPGQMGAASVQHLGLLVRMKASGAREGGILHGQGALSCLEVQ